MSTRKPLYGFLTAQGVSLVGTRVSMIALPWFVLTTTGSATETGLVAFAEMTPLVILKVLGGPIIDRLGARRVSIGCDVASLVAVSAIPALYAVGWLSFPVFLLLVALAGALRGPGDGAKTALVPHLVEQAAVPMERATGLSATVERTASMLGAAFAGGLVALIGPADALVVDAISFGLSALVLAWATRPLPSRSDAGRPVPGRPDASRPVPGPVVADDAVETPAGYLTQLREGWQFLRGDRVLIGIAVMVALTNLLDLAYASLLVPVWAKESGGGAGAIGLLFAVFSGASVCGALMAAAWGTRLPRFKTYLFAFLIGGAPRFVVLVHGSPLWAVLAVAVVAGVTGGFINPVLGAVIFERIPSALMGRVTSLSTAMCFALMPFGGLLGGVLVSTWGLTVALLACGAAYFAVTMLPALDPRWREMDRRPAVPAEPVEPGDPAAAGVPG
ncbi:MFS transporter [Nocardioides panaciterrulae]|uniref:MFS family permease n=1 Tax=Nocardioides panaciterrulae TaxID=661492 RepID=A0A7Y9E312_9ACTN|nr:MFS transporter [Nocardioides panaciterrulae]NYD40184.1 MFS family permease [Nocardioides panaciterrulae]